VVVFGGGEGKVLPFVKLHPYSFRGDEVSSGDPVFPTGAQRGNPGTDDWFHVVSIRFRYPIFDRTLEMDFPRYLFRKKGWPYHN
jgi:hypothetical protein